MKIGIVKAIDRGVGTVLAALFPAPARRAVAAPRRILVIRPGGIGDAVLLVPALLALREKFSDAEITVLAERRNAGVFSLCPAVDRLLHYDIGSELAQAVRGGYDLVIDSEQWHRLSAVVARLTRAPLSIGFATNNRKRLFLHRVSYSHERYEADSFFELLLPLGIAPPAALQFPFLLIPHQASRRAAELLAPLAPRRYVVVFPGASIPERRWGAVRYKEVARRLVAEGFIPVVVGGKDDAAEGEVIVDALGGLNLAGKTTLAETAALIAGSTLLVSGDSGVLHIAVGLGIPTVSLFGPGIQEKWGPRGEGDVVLSRRLPCSPCTRFGTTRPCPIQARCMTDISPEEVFAAAKSTFSAARVTTRFLPDCLAT